MNEHIQNLKDMSAEMERIMSAMSVLSQKMEFERTSLLDKKEHSPAAVLINASQNLDGSLIEMTDCSNNVKEAVRLLEEKMK